MTMVDWEPYRLTLTISGRVQGVFFRESAKDIAIKLKLVGRIKNNPDGTVGVVAEGEKPALEEFLVFCRRGPDHAVVEGVEGRWEEKTRTEFSSFQMLT